MIHHMEKGILYLGCTVIILAALILSMARIDTKLDKIAAEKPEASSVKVVMPTPTIVPTASPSAAVKEVVKPSVMTTRGVIK